MYGKIFISFLLVALINFLVGCYSSELVNITVPEYKQVVEEVGKQDEIRVITKGSQEYHFSNSGYYIENDMLYGKASFRGELSFEGSFAFSEIESIQIGSFGVTVSGYQKIEAKSGKPDEIYLTKNDFTKYHFMKDDYYIENDTLYGKGKLIVDEKLLDRNIALSDIESIQFEYEYVDGLKTTSLFLGTIGIILIIAAVIALQDFKLPFGGKK